MMTIREKVRLNQMLVSGDIENIRLAFEMIIQLGEGGNLIERAKNRLHKMKIFFEEKCLEYDEKTKEHHTAMSPNSIGGSDPEYEKTEEELYQRFSYYVGKLNDTKLKIRSFDMVYLEIQLFTKYFTT